MSGDSILVYGKKTRLVQFFSQVVSGTVNSPATAAPEAFDEAILFVDTAVAGTTMTVHYQLSDDDGTTWWTRASTTAITATGQTLLTIPDTVGRMCRLQAVTTGSFTITARVEFKRIGEG